MKRFKFLGVWMRSNTLSTKGSTYTFKPEQIYDENDMINLFVELHPNRWEEVSNEVVEDVVFIDEKAKEDFTEALEDEKLDSDIVAFNNFIETDGDVEGYLNDGVHWTKIKQIAEYLDIEWTKKDETIRAIVDSL